MTDTGKEWLEQTTQRLVRQRAHELWVQEHKPEGRAQEHWLRAEIEVEAELLKAARPFFSKAFRPRAGKKKR